MIFFWGEDIWETTFVKPVSGCHRRKIPFWPRSSAAAAQLSATTSHLTEGDPKQIRQLAIHHRTRRPTCHTHAGLHQKTHELVKAKNKGRPGSSRLWRRRCPSLRRTAATGSSTTSRRSRGTRPRPRPTPGHSRLAPRIRNRFRRHAVLGCTLAAKITPPDL
jgi:hypothetical protein